jgi:hypothetical protein
VKRVLIFLLMTSLPVFAQDAAMQKLQASLFFVANEGQWEEPFAFKAAVGNAVYYVTATGMTMDIREYERPQRARDPMDRFEMRHEPEPMNVRGHVLKMNFVNANAQPEIIGEEKLSSYSNYFIGRDSCKWRSFVGHYQTVRMKNVWNGIDAELRIQEEGVETIYRVQAGANASQIMVQYEGLDAPLQTDGQGNLLLQTSLGTIKEKAPFAYQIVNQRQVEVPVRFQPLSNDRYRLSFEAFDAGQELVIDPLVYGTYLGGSGPDEAFDVAVSQTGLKAVVGYTEGNDFPVTPGAYQTQGQFSDGFITVFTSSADSLVFSSYLHGPTGWTDLKCICFDTNGSIYVGGSTSAPHFPITQGAFDSVMGGGYDGIFVRFNSTGSALEYSSFIGGSGDIDGVLDVAIDRMGLVYLCGQKSNQPGFPLTSNALFSNNESGGFLTVFDPQTESLRYSTFTPGTAALAFNVIPMSYSEIWLTGSTAEGGLPITLNAAQSQFGGQWDGFITLWNLQANTLDYCSYLGGSANDYVIGCTIRRLREIILVGRTNSPEFPTTQSAYDTIHGSGNWSKAFVTVVSLDSSIIASSLLGGTAGSGAGAVNADSNSILVTGTTWSPDFPITHGAFDTTNNGYDIFISKFDSRCTRLEYSTFIGSSGTDYQQGAYFVNLDTLWIVGQAGSGDFPITPNAFQNQNHGFSDAFLLEFALPESTSAVTNRESLLPTNMALSIFPNPFNPSTTIAISLTRPAPVTINVFDILGRIIFIHDLGTLPAGTHDEILRANALTSGTYLIRVRAGHQMLDSKIFLLR